MSSGERPASESENENDYGLALADSLRSAMESGKPKKNSKRRVESPSDHPDPQPSPIDLTRSETPSVSASGPSSNSHTVSGPSALQTGATTPAPTRPKPTPTAKKPRGPPPGVRADHFNAHTLHAQPQQQTKQKEDHITKRVSIIPARKKAVPSSRKRPEDVPPPVASRPSASTSRKRVEDFPPPTPVRTVKKPRLNTPSPETEDRDSSPPPKRAASTRSRNAESKNVPDRSRDQTDSLVQVELASLRTDVASLKENTCVITADHAAVKASQEATSKTQETLSRRVEAVEQSGAAYTQSLERIQAETEAVMETFKKEMKEFRAEQEIVRAQISSLAKITTLETMMDVMRRDVNKLTARHGASEQLIEQLRALYESRISNEASSSSLLDQSPRFVPAVNVEEICSLVSDHMHDTMYAAVKMLVKGFLKETFPESWEPDKWVSGLRHAEDRQRQAQMLVDRMQERQERSGHPASHQDDAERGRQSHFRDNRRHQQAPRHDDRSASMAMQRQPPPPGPSFDPPRQQTQRYPSPTLQPRRSNFGFEEFRGQNLISPEDRVRLSRVPSNSFNAPTASQDTAEEDARPIASTSAASATDVGRLSPTLGLTPPHESKDEEQEAFRYPPRDSKPDKDVEMLLPPVPSRPRTPDRPSPFLAPSAPLHRTPSHHEPERELGMSSSSTSRRRDSQSAQSRHHRDREPEEDRSRGHRSHSRTSSRHEHGHHRSHSGASSRHGHHDGHRRSSGHGDRHTREKRRDSEHDSSYSRHEQGHDRSDMWDKSLNDGGSRDVREGSQRPR